MSCIVFLSSKHRIFGLREIQSKPKRGHSYYRAIDQLPIQFKTPGGRPVTRGMLKDRGVSVQYLGDWEKKCADLDGEALRFVFLWSERWKRYHKVYEWGQASRLITASDARKANAEAISEDEVPDDWFVDGGLCYASEMIRDLNLGDYFSSEHSVAAMISGALSKASCPLDFGDRLKVLRVRYELLSNLVF